MKPIPALCKANPLINIHLKICHRSVVCWTAMWTNPWLSLRYATHPSAGGSYSYSTKQVNPPSHDPNNKSAWTWTTDRPLRKSVKPVSVNNDKLVQQAERSFVYHDTGSPCFTPAYSGSGSAACPCICHMSGGSVTQIAATWMYTYFTSSLVREAPSGWLGFTYHF